MPTRYLNVIRPKSRLAVWIWSPVIVLRIALFLVYIVYIYAAGIAVVAGIPIFAQTAPGAYTVMWAIGLGVSAAVSAIGAVNDKWQPIEKWGTLVLSALMLGYAGTLNIVGFMDGDIGRQFVGTIATIALILPATRFVYLAAQSGKTRVNHAVPPGIG